MSFSFGKTSLARLDTLEPELKRVCLLALKKASAQSPPQDIMVLEGARPLARQQALYGQGRTAADMRAKKLPTALAKPHLKKVTWTLQSAHLPNARGLSNAVDLAPFPLDWEDIPAFDRVAKAMFAAAAELNIPIRWGADWDRDGNPRERGESDSPHFELANKK